MFVADRHMPISQSGTQIRHMLQCGIQATIDYLVIKPHLRYTGQKRNKKGACLTVCRTSVDLRVVLRLQATGRP